MWYAGAVEALFEATATGRTMAKGRSLSQFQEAFPDEASCAAFLSERRWPEGFVCPGCGEQRAAALKSRAYTYECLDCGRQTSATAGTVMHRSKLPLTTWFWAAHLMATHSNGMSARQLEDQLGVTYKTAWLLAQKLRRAVVDPDRDLLEGVVEVDQTEIPFRAGDAFFEPSAAGKILVVGAVEVIDRSAGRPKPRRKGAKYLDTRSGRLRLSAIADNSAKSIETFVRANVKPGATLITDGPCLLSGALGRLPTRSARCREHGGQHRPALEPPRLLVAEALGARDLSWSAPQTCRRLSQRIRISLQPPLSSARLVRDGPRTRNPSRSRDLPRHRQPRRRSPSEVDQPTTYRSP